MDLATWLGGGLLAVLAYVIVSNVAWLLIGSRLLQCLPGVDIKGFRGTVRLATMLLLTAVGTACWAGRSAWIFTTRSATPRTLPQAVATWVARGSRWSSRIFEKRPDRTSARSSESR